MHMVLLGDSQLQIFQFEHEQRTRLSNRRRLVAEAQKAERAEAKSAASRGFIPRLAGALGLL